MARPRTPTNILEARGAFKKHPERRPERENEPVDLPELGEPPKEFCPDQAQAWNDIVEACPDGVLTGSDSLAVEVAARLLAQIRTGSLLDTRLYSQFTALLGKFGMTPADRS